MGITIVLFALWFSMSFSSKKPPELYLKALRETCFELANEQKVKDKLFEKFVVECINEELSTAGFRKITHPINAVHQGRKK